MKGRGQNIFKGCLHRAYLIREDHSLLHFCLSWARRASNMSPLPGGKVQSLSLHLDVFIGQGLKRPGLQHRVVHRGNIGCFTTTSLISGQSQHWNPLIQLLHFLTWALYFQTGVLLNPANKHVSSFVSVCVSPPHNTSPTAAGWEGARR